MFPFLFCFDKYFNAFVIILGCILFAIYLLLYTISILLIMFDTVTFYCIIYYIIALHHYIIIGQVDMNVLRHYYFILTPALFRRYYDQQML